MEARLRKNLDMDVFNVCRLTTHFLTHVLTLEQYVQLLAAAHPHPLNVMVSPPLLPISHQRSRRFNTLPHTAAVAGAAMPPAKPLVRHT